MPDEMSRAEAFEAFVRRYEGMVYATAVRLVGRPSDAEDIAQTVFLKAFEHFDRLESSAAAPGWLKTAATNASLNLLRRHRARWRLFSELHAAEDSRPFESQLVAPVASNPIEEADETATLERALRALPDHQRVPIVLFHFDNRSYQEIATLLGVSLGKVKTDIHRGREALRKYLTHELV